MKKVIPTLCFAAVLLFAACRKESPKDPLDLELEAALLDASAGAGMDYYRLPTPGNYNDIPQDSRNPITKQKVELGRLLFHDSGLALGALHADHLGTYSCASCHFAAAGFQAGRHQGIGDGGLGFGMNGEGRMPDPAYTGMELDVQPVRSPSILNAAYQEAMIWNGQFGALGVNAGTETSWTTDTPKEVNHLGFEGLETQAIAGQAVHRQEVDPDFIFNSSYRGLFDLAFADMPAEERYTAIAAGLAMAAYERTVLADQAPFQRWLRGNQHAMTNEEKLGAVLFFTKAECWTCHNGPSLANMEFHGLGMDDLHNCPEPTFRSGPAEGANLGRGGFTGNPADNFHFKVPQLYNLADSPFYGHGSSLRSVRAVLDYKNAGIPQRTDIPAAQLSPHFKPLGLTSTELDQLEAFINRALYDDKLDRYEPTHLPSGACIPNNDPVSQVDLDCN